MIYCSPSPYWNCDFKFSIALGSGPGTWNCSTQASVTSLQNPGLQKHPRTFVFGQYE